MSAASSVFGIGFYTNISDKALAAFIDNHGETVKKLDNETGLEALSFVRERLGTKMPLDDLMEKFFDYEGIYSGDTGLCAIIADVMYKESGVGFEYRVSPEVGESDAVVFPVAFPWQMSDFEKSLTEKAMEDIVRKYTEELGLGEPQDIYIEYCG